MHASFLIAVNAMERFIRESLCCPINNLKLISKTTPWDQLSFANLSSRGLNTFLRQFELQTVHHFTLRNVY